MSGTYCPFIFHQKKIDSRNRVGPCCHFKESSTYEDYDSMIQPYREAISRGEKIEPCRRCWQDEEKGFPSLRQSGMRDFKRLGNPKGIMMLDLRISNKCNLACSMCNHKASSLWGKISGTNLEYVLDEEIQDDIIASSTDLVKVSVQGGEPFYGNDFIDFVDRLPNKSNIEIELFSNTITADTNVLARWVQEFRKVAFIASVDGTGKAFEEIRWPASWAKLDRKIREIDGIEGLSLGFNFTLQNLNLLNLADFVAWKASVVPRASLMISVLEHPEHLHFTVIDEDERAKALDMLGRMDKGSDFIVQRTINSVQKQLADMSVDRFLLEKRETELAKISELRKNWCD